MAVTFLIVLSVLLLAVAIFALENAQVVTVRWPSSPSPARSHYLRSEVPDIEALCQPHTHRGEGRERFIWLH